MPKKNSQSSFTWLQVASFRLRRQHLADDRKADLASVARDACGIQAQVLSAAELAFRVRRPATTHAEIQAALWKDRTLVKTSCMRGTLHILAAADFPIYMSALRSSRTRDTLRILNHYGASEEEGRAVMEAAIDALAGGPMTRIALTEKVLALGIVKSKARIWFRESWWGVARQALFEGRVCYGPVSAGNVTIVRTDHWLPGLSFLDEEEAKQILLRRYLGSYGPATFRDFAKWSGFAMPEASAVWKSIEKEFSEVMWDGRAGFVLRKDLRELRAARPPKESVRLLPNFDVFLLGHVEKDHFVSKRDYKKIYRNAGWISAAVLAGGRIVGTWRAERAGKRLNFEFDLFEKISREVRAGIEAEAANIAAFNVMPFEVNLPA